MKTAHRAAALALVATVTAGCALAPPATAPVQPATATPTAAPPPTASATPAPAPLDLTLPGEAERLVDELMDAANALQAIMVTVTASDASVTVVRDGQAQTWAWRDERVQQVPSDITYVAQRMFDPDDFELGDVGALFRSAEAVSGSRRGQSLQIVDYSAGLVSMSVSTVPESRPVFFKPDGTLLPTLDFTSAWGLQQGYADAVGDRRVATAIGFGSAIGVHLDGLQGPDGTSQRRQRTARTPVIVTARTEGTVLRPFDASLVDPDAVWGVLERHKESGDFSLDRTWSCIVDDRAALGVPRMYFTIGDETFTTDLDGRAVE